MVSFDQIAKNILKLNKQNSLIKYLRRIGKMPHNGYRAFDNRESKNLLKRILNVNEG